MRDCCFVHIPKMMPIFILVDKTLWNLPFPSREASTKHWLIINQSSNRLMYRYWHIFYGKWTFLYAKSLYKSRAVQSCTLSHRETCFHYRGTLFLLQGPFFHYRDFPVRKSTQGKPCFHYREWVCSVCISVCLRPHGLETRVIIKISTYLCYPKTLECLLWDKAIFFSLSLF